MDQFLTFVEPLLLGPMSPDEAQRHTGPHAYVIQASAPLSYPLGLSYVGYIGFTDNPRSRFVSHNKLNPGESIWLMPLRGVLGQVKDCHPLWREMDTRQNRALREEAERILYYWFVRLMGAKPVRNGRMPAPTREGMLVAQIALNLQRGGPHTSEAHPVTFNSDGHWIAREIERRLPTRLQRRTSGRGTLVLSNHRTDLLLLRSFGEFCRVRVKCAGLGSCHVADHANLRDAQNWLAPVRVDSEYQLSRIVASYRQDWVA